MKYLKRFKSQEEHDRCLNGGGEYQLPSVALIFPESAEGGVSKRVNFLNGHYLKQMFFNAGGGKAANDKKAFTSFRVNGTEELIKKNEVVTSSVIDIYIDSEWMQNQQIPDVQVMKITPLISSVDELIGSTVVFDEPIPENLGCVLSFDFFSSSNPVNISNYIDVFIESGIITKIDERTIKFTEKVFDITPDGNPLVVAALFPMEGDPENYTNLDPSFFTRSYTHTFKVNGRLKNVKEKEFILDATKVENPDDLLSLIPAPKAYIDASTQQICKRYVMQLDEVVDPYQTFVAVFADGVFNPDDIIFDMTLLADFIEYGLVKVSEGLKTLDWSGLMGYISLMLMFDGDNMPYNTFSLSLYTPLSDTEIKFVGNTTTFLEYIGDGLSVDADAQFANIQWKKNIIPDKLFQGSCVTNFSDGAFEYFTTFGSSAFENSSLNSIVIPDTVNRIGDKAFANCRNLQSFTLGANAVNVDFNSVFTGTTKIDNFSISPANRRYDSRDNCNAVVDTLTNTIVKGFENSTCPDTIKTIGPSAFQGLSGLTQYTIGANVETIGEKAFGNCSSLSEINIPDSVISIANSAFTSCSKATVLTLGKNVETIGDYAFYYCSKIKDIVIPNSVKQLGKYSFASCAFNNVVIDAETIGEYTFSNTSIGNLSIGENVRTIGSHAFYGTGSLTGLTITNGVEELGDYCFQYNRSLKSVSIPGSIKNMGIGVFENCTSLTNVTLEDGITMIGEDAFYGCSKLSAITIPNSVMYIGSYALSNCAFPKTGSYFTYADTCLTKCATGYTSGALKSNLRFIGSRAFSDCTKMTSIAIPSGVCQIGHSAFTGCNGLKKLQMPKGLKRIEHSAFSGCAELNEIVLNEGLEYIGGNVFGEVVNVFRLELPTSLTTLNGYTFQTMRNLQELHIHSGVTEIINGNPVCFTTGLQKLTISPDNPVYTDGGNGFIIEKATNKLIGATTSGLIPNNITIIDKRAFGKNLNIKNIIVPDSVTDILEGAFEACETNTITLGSGVKTIGDGAFSGCTEIQEISLPDSLTTLGESGFTDCISLKSVHIGSGLQEIPRNSFYRCKSLTGVTIPDNITSIKSYAFAYCSDLKSVTLGANVETIGEYAFSGCSYLTGVTIPDSVTTIGRRAFAYCKSLTSVTIPDNVTTIGNYAFHSCTNLKEITLGAGIQNFNQTMLMDTQLETIISNNPRWRIENGMLLEGNKVLHATKYANVIPVGTIDIQTNAFRGCSIESIEIPGSINTIVSSCFMGCNRLRSVVFHEGVQTIKDAFSSCTNLFELTLPTSVKHFGAGTPQLRRLYSYAQTPPTLDYNSFGYNTTNGVYYYPMDADYTSWTSQAWEGFVIDNTEVDLSLGEYNIVCGYNVNTTTGATPLINNLADVTGMEIDGIAVDPVSAYTFTTLGKHVVKYQASNISENMFKLIKRLYKCVLAEGFTEIAASAFYGCYGLEELPNIPSTVTHIQNFAFYNTNGNYEATIELPENLIYIGPSAFARSAFKEVKIKANVTEIGSNAFSAVTPLVSVTIEDSPVTLGNNVFTGCPNLEHLDLGANANIPYATIVDSKKLSTDDGIVYMGDTALYVTKPQEVIRIKEGTKNISKSFGASLSHTKHVIIPDSVTRIENSTFSSTGIRNVTIGNGVEYIGQNAFNKCLSLTSITIPDSVKTIDYSAFYNCSGATELTLGSSVEKIGGSAFQYASRLRKVVIPSSVKTIGSDAFASTWGLKEVTFLDSECSLEYEVFAYTHVLDKISLGTKIQNIPSTMFINSNRLCEFTIPASVTGWSNSWISRTPLNRLNVYAKEVPSYAFDVSLSLTDLVLGDGVETVGQSAFLGCKYLSAVTIASTVKRISDYAFSGCTSIVDFTLPDTVESVSASAFNGCNFITTENGMRYVNNCLLGPVNKNQTGYTIKDSVINIAGNAFESCKSLKEIVIPDNVKFVGPKAFFNCQNVESYTIGTGITKISQSMFGQCYKLSSVTIPDTVTNIDNKAFEYCTGVTDVVIGANVENIGSGAFSSCKSLSSVTMGENVKNVDSDLFYGCTSLTNIVEMPESITNIANSMYYGCTSLSSITIPEHITQIGSYGFAQCSGISEITLGSNLTHIGGYAFSGCTSITNVVIPDNVISMGIYAFAYCTGLTDITIGSGVTELGNNVFANCTSLSSVTIPDNVTSIGSSAFMKCTSLSSVTIPDSVTSIGYSAFTKCHSLQKITCLSRTAPTIYSSTFSGTTDNVTVYYPTGSDYSSWANLHPNWTFLPNLHNLECVSLSITADDVVGNATSTTIYYAATMQGVNNLGELETYTETGKTASDVFPQNTSETDTVVRTITFEYYGMTATTTITQGGWVNHNYTITLNDQWRKSTTVANPDETLYDGVYESFSNINVDSSEAVAYIDIAGYDEFSMYIRSYGENDYDYVMVSELDQNITRGTSYSNTTYVKGHTRSKSTSGNAVSNYTKLTWAGIGNGAHRITVLYGKDGSSKSGTDQGYFFIPKQ